MNSYPTVFKILVLGVLICSGIYSSQVTADSKNRLSFKKEFRIMHHEHLKALRFARRNETFARQQANNDSVPPAEVSFDAYGRHFDMDLETNEHLLDNLPTQQKQRLKQSIQLYKGKLHGIKGSWVRMNRTGNRLTGAFWDGHDLYIIDNSDKVKENIADDNTAASTQPYNLIYKLSDTQTEAACAVEAQPANSITSLVNELQSQVQALAQASKKLDVAIVADAQFSQANSSNPQAAVMARMNVVDGIYSEQVGVHLNIAEIRALSSNGGMTATSPGTLLTQFASYTASAGFTNPGIAHLFTGRDLDGSTVGIAYLSVLCRRDVGVGVSQTNGTGIAGALTVAHEMGHNFGAPHDNQSGSACATAPSTYIMNPVLNGSTQFSSCSLQQMAARISTAACITNITTTTPVADVRPVFPVNPVNTTVNSNFSVKVEVRNGGNATATGSTAKITIPAGIIVNQAASTLGQCQISGQTVNCNVGNLSANGVATITLNLKAGASAANLQSTVQVGAGNDSNSTNNTAYVAIKIGAIPVSPSIIFQTDFNANTGGFVYLDNTFLGTVQPNYASGNRVVSASDGKLEVVLGGINDLIINGMSGGWRKSFTLTAPKSVTLSFDFKVDQTAHYESDEWSDALLSLNGNLIGLNGGSFLTRVIGNGEEGSPLTSGNWRVNITRSLLAGTHTITLGGYNNKKTSAREITRVYFDNVKLIANP